MSQPIWERRVYYRSTQSVCFHARPGGAETGMHVSWRSNLSQPYLRDGFYSWPGPLGWHWVLHHTWLSPSYSGVLLNNGVVLEEIQRQELSQCNRYTKSFYFSTDFSSINSVFKTLEEIYFIPLSENTHSLWQFGEILYASHRLLDI